MTISRLPESVVTLYAELLDQTIQAEAERVARSLPPSGSFQSKTVKGHAYWYLQRVVAGRGVLVTVPAPARFALHKLWLAGRRRPGEQAKAGKDRRQARGVIEVLREDRPRDLPRAWEAVPEARRPGIERERAALGMEGTIAG